MVTAHGHGEVADGSANGYVRVRACCNWVLKTVRPFAVSCHEKIIGRKSIIGI